MTRVLKPKPITHRPKSDPKPQLVFLYLCEFVEILNGDPVSHTYATSELSRINPKDKIIGTRLVELTPGKFDFSVKRST